MNFVSLFAGVGGFDLAFERVGMECVAQVEIDAKCRQVLANHWPDVSRFEDVREVSGLDDLGSVDVLCGGFPCQDYSVAGKRGGLAGDRGALWWQFHRLIAECRPRWVVGENVPGLLSSNGGRDFGAIVGSLVELGYGVVWRVLDAQYFGVAQRRRRVFIVGHIGGIPRPEILAFAEGCAGDSAPVRTAGQAAAPTLAARVNGGGGLCTDHDLDGGLIVPVTASSLGAAPRGVPNAEQAKGQLIAFNWQSGQDQLSARETYIDALHAGQTPAIAFAQNTRDEVRDLGNLAGALSAESGSHQTTYLASPQVRRLTPLECERLQGFPGNWTAGQSDTQRYRQMGNAVAVPVVEWIGKQLVKVE